MKKVTLTFSLIISLVVMNYSQSCLPDGLLITKQSEIDSFQINYPGCTNIEGHLLIEGNNISDLSNLNVLTSIDGGLTVTYTSLLTSLNGLDNITYLGKQLFIWYTSNLTNLSGLEGLTTLNGDLEIWDNNHLNNIGSLSNLTSVNGNVSILGNIKLESLTGLNNIASIGGFLEIKWNDTLLDLNGFEKLNNIDGDLAIWNNPELTSIIGLDSIDPVSIINLSVMFNDKLSDCAIFSICEYLANPTGDLDIFYNATGCYNQEQVEENCLVNIHTNQMLNLEVEIFPNPAKQSISILTSDNKINRITIYNQLGQVMLKKVQPGKNIDISMLNSGIYLMEVGFKEYRIQKKLVIE